MTKGEKPIMSFGFPEERVSKSGHYTCVFPGFADVLISAEGDLLIWKLYDDKPTPAGLTQGTSGVHRFKCDNVLQALGRIYELLKEHGKTQYLPTEVSDE